MCPSKITIYREYYNVKHAENKRMEIEKKNLLNEYGTRTQVN